MNMEKKQMLESLQSKLTKYVLNTLIYSKYRKIIHDLHNNPDFIDASRKLENAIEDLDRSAARAEKSRRDFSREKAKYIAQYGQDSFNSITSKISKKYGGSF